ncbi:hypothetical protein EVAR_7332_1 [Eumeta japonica]|uniref:Uncharacterized protein n=1 Tax=Eumeta variegata TaxID=151549 RepID=A0A4C1T664_EUMVA|nr:hypothetical protein EVAR_7332_1 [Eumeta japonica]
MLRNLKVFLKVLSKYVPHVDVWSAPLEIFISNYQIRDSVYAGSLLTKVRNKERNKRNGRALRHFACLRPPCPARSGICLLVHRFCRSPRPRLPALVRGLQQVVGRLAAVTNFVCGLRFIFTTRFPSIFVPDFVRMPAIS